MHSRDCRIHHAWSRTQVNVAQATLRQYNKNLKNPKLHSVGNSFQVSLQPMQRRAGQADRCSARRTVGSNSTSTLALAYALRPVLTVQRLSPVRLDAMQSVMQDQKNNKQKKRNIRRRKGRRRSRATRRVTRRGRLTCKETRI